MPRASPPDNNSNDSTIINFLLLIFGFIFAMIGLSAGSTFSPRRIKHLDSLSGGKIGENYNDTKRTRRKY